MPTSSDPQSSQQTQAGGEASRKQSQWGSPQPHPHCPAAASFSRQSQLCQVPHAGKLGTLQDFIQDSLRGHSGFLLFALSWAWFARFLGYSEAPQWGLERQESSFDFKSSHMAVALNV